MTEILFKGHFKTKKNQPVDALVTVLLKHNFFAFFLNLCVGLVINKLLGIADGQFM